MSYSVINLTKDTHFTWNYPYVEGYTIISDINDLIVEDDNIKVYLPSGSNIELGTSVIFNNISSKKIDIYDCYGGQLIIPLDSGNVVQVYFIGTDNEPGVKADHWRAILTIGGSIGVIGVNVIASTDNTITVEGEEIGSGMSGSFTIGANPVITGLGKLGNNSLSQGLIVSTDESATTFSTISMLEGNNITIINPNGSTGDISIGLSSDVINLTSLHVGDLNFSSNSVMLSDTDKNLILNSITIDNAGNITSSGTDKGLTLNQVNIDDAGNITSLSTDKNLILNSVSIDDAGNIISLSTDQALTLNGINIDSNSKISALNTDKSLSLNGVMIDQTGNVVFSDSASLKIGDLELTENSLTVTDIHKNLVLNNIEITDSGDLTLPSLVSLNIGKLKITENTLSFVDENRGFSVNGLSVDKNGNVIIPGNLIIGDGLSVISPIKTWVYFTNTLTANANIDIFNSENIESIMVDEGYYTITFIAPMPDTNYGVLITPGSIGTPPNISVRHGYVINRQTTDVVITLVDASGQVLQDAPNGITMAILIP